ncbi:four-helix bundle copper-binding protein [Streptomyces cyaneofuscatus]
MDFRLPCGAGDGRGGPGAGVLPAVGRPGRTASGGPPRGPVLRIPGCNRSRPLSGQRRHADTHNHRRVCAEACRRCEQVRNDLIASLD